ncbi:MAG: hypothetical protein AAFQ43_01590 [Bacteroidota bacterium]
MKATLRDAAIGALIGSLAVVGTFGLLVVIGIVRVAPWVAMWQALIGGEGWIVPALAGGVLFIAIGVLWGLPFVLVEEPGPFKGFVYGIVPTLWAWTGMPLLMDAAPMGGLDPVNMGLPVVMNCVIWGSILGWYTREKVFGSGGGGGAVYY